MDSKTKDALKQLQAEVRQLQMAITQNQASAEPDLPEDDKTPRKERASPIVQYSAPSSAPDSNGKPSKPHQASFTELQLDKVTDEAASAVGYAVASPQKIGLLRALWKKESEGAANLGEATHLSTGSLYHHLRELMRADLVTQSRRNRYVLSPRGARVLLLVLALAAEN